MNNRNKKWKDYSRSEKARIIIMAIINLTMVTLTLVDLRRRPANMINGKKWAWALFAFVQPIGPISYFLFGRKR